MSAEGEIRILKRPSVGNGFLMNSALNQRMKQSNASSVNDCTVYHIITDRSPMSILHFYISPLD